MKYYHECPYCGLNLDPCEICDCVLKQNNENYGIRNARNGNYKLIYKKENKNGYE